MTNVRVSGFKIFKDRHGKRRCYHRLTLQKIDLQKYPLGSAEFFAKCSEIAAYAEAKKTLQPRAGTLGQLLEIYFKTEHFRNLAASTQRDYRKCADYLKPIGDTSIDAIKTPLIAGIHDKASSQIGWRRANMLRTFLSQVFKFNVPKGLIDQDYAAGVIPKPRPKDRARANRPWSDSEKTAVLENANPHVRVAIALMMNTGLDPSDALQLMRNQIDGGTIWGVRGKTGQSIAIPIGKALNTALNEAPIHSATTILANSRGKPWTYNGFSTVWHRFKTSLEDSGQIQPGLTLKGLRHTLATTLREAGLNERAIADLLGQKTPEMARHYSRDANLAEKNRRSMDTYDNENERRSKVVKPFRKTVKP